MRFIAKKILSLTKILGSFGIVKGKNLFYSENNLRNGHLIEMRCLLVSKIDNIVLLGKKQAFSQYFLIPDMYVRSPMTKSMHPINLITEEFWAKWQKTEKFLWEFETANRRILKT